MNRLLMSGVVVGKPETRTLSGGAKVASFVVRVERPRREGASLVFDDVKAEAWGCMAEQVARLQEGTPVLVDATMKVSTWTSYDGVPHSKTYVNTVSIVVLPPGETVGMLDEPCAAQPPSAPPSTPPPEAPAAPEVPADMAVPF